MSKHVNSIDYAYQLFGDMDERNRLGGDATVLFMAMMAQTEVLAAIVDELREVNQALAAIHLYN